MKQKLQFDVRWTTDARLRATQDLTPTSAAYVSAIERMVKYDEEIMQLERSSSYNVESNYARSGNGPTLRKQQHKEVATLPFPGQVITKLEVAEVHNTRGTLLASRDKLEEALEAYSQAIQLDPWNEEFYFNKTAVLRRLG